MSIRDDQNYYGGGIDPDGIIEAWSGELTHRLTRVLKLVYDEPPVIKPYTNGGQNGMVPGDPSVWEDKDPQKP